MKIPQEVEMIMPLKVKMYEKMQEIEEQINNFIRSKLLDVKESGFKHDL